MIPNLRDIGESINLIHGKKTLKEDLIFRGGSVNELFSKDELPKIETIINLRKGPDKYFDGIRNIHIPATDTLDNYLTDKNKIQVWVNQVLSVICTNVTWPILLHCTAGKDRTGVIVATILKAIGTTDEDIKEEYLFSDGIKDSSHIDTALKGLGNIESYIYDQEIMDKLKQKLRL